MAARKPRWSLETAVKNAAKHIAVEPPFYADRPEPRGEFVAKFVLPPELCLTGNACRHKPGWAIQKVKDQLWTMMRAQWFFQRTLDRRPLPLSGRPDVLCARFTSRPVDAVSDWAKFPVDMLTKATKKEPRHRLGLIQDDDPISARVCQWWEKVPASEAVVLIRVFTGGSIVG